MLVSVIIPTYNRASFLKEAIESVLGQSYEYFELIIVDDGSTDDTKQLVQSFKDKRISYFYQENKGVSQARNLGIKKSQGEVIAFLDSDDFWLKDKLKKQIFFLQESDFWVVQCKEKWIRKGKFVNPCFKHRMPAGWFWEKALKLCLIGPSCVLLRREVFEEIGLFDPRLKACEDYELWLRLLLFFPVGIVPEALVVKRGGHFDQLSRSILGLDLFRIYALRKILTDFSLSRSEQRLLQEELKEKIDIYVKGCLKRGKIEEAIRLRELESEIRKNK